MKNLITSPFIFISMILMMNVNHSSSAGLEKLEFDPDDSPLLESPIVDDMNEGERPWKVGESSQFTNTKSTFQEWEKDWDQYQKEKQFSDKNEEDKPQEVGQSAQLVKRKYTFQNDPDWDQSEKEQQFCEDDKRWPELENIKKNDSLRDLCVDFSSWNTITPPYNRLCPEPFQMNYGSKKQRTVSLEGGSCIIKRVMLSCKCFDQVSKWSTRYNEHAFIVAKHNDTSYYYLKDNVEKTRAHIFGYVENFIIKINF